TQKRTDGRTGKSYPWVVRSTAMVNHYYFYGVDEDFGPFFLKFCSYFPYNGRLYFNGHEYAKRQMSRNKIEYEALDNGVQSCTEVKKLQNICDGLSAEKSDAFCRKWLRQLPHPYTAADRNAGYRYALSILQAEFSLTQVLDRPVAGRPFFEEVIRENIEQGRPITLSFFLVLRSSAPRPVCFEHESLLEVSLPRCMCSTKARESSNIIRKVARSEPKPPSMTRATSASANGFTICRHYSRSAS